jgi:D-glycero-D-manno-heptose 1,7-bisphosphate phosphatase
MVAKVVLLDRDGVINNDSDDYVRTVDEWVPINGSIEAIARLYHAGYRIFVITNQSGLARGYFTLSTLKQMHTKFCDLLTANQARVEHIYFCQHAPDVNCDCRKPKTGLLRQLVSDTGLDLTGVPFVGDSLRDLQAADNFGCSPVLVKTGNGKNTLNQPLPANTQIFADLADFTQQLLSAKI